MFVHPLHVRVLPVWPQVFADGSHEFSTPVHTRTHVEPDTDRGRAADERERRGLLASEEAEEVGVELGWEVRGWSHENVRSTDAVTARMRNLAPP